MKTNQDKINLEELQDKAFELLPHTRIYNDKREVIGIIDWSATDIPELPCYEEFDRQLDFYCEYEDENGIRSLAKWLERIEKGIDLVADVNEFPEPDWIVEGLVVRRGLTMLYGDSGVGKTTFNLYLTDSVQKGKDLFGLECKQGDVIFIEQDESPELLRSHKDKIGIPEHLQTCKVNILWDGKGFNKELRDLLHYYAPDVVVIDAYTSLGIVDINRPESALVLDELRRLAVEYDCAFIIVHHTNKSREQMGSSLHVAKMDSIISMTKTQEDKVLVAQDKVRGSKFQTKVLKFNQVSLEMKDVNMTLKDEVRTLKASGQFKDTEIINRFPKTQRDSVRRYLREPSGVVESN